MIVKPAIEDAEDFLIDVSKFHGLGSGFLVVVVGECGLEVWREGDDGIEVDLECLRGGRTRKDSHEFWIGFASV